MLFKAFEENIVTACHLKPILFIFTVTLNKFLLRHVGKGFMIKITGQN